jgi:hypothetical protein
MKKFAVVITREEKRVVWAENEDEAQDVALDECDGAQLRDENEEMTDVRVYLADEGEPALNEPARTA